MNRILIPLLFSITIHVPSLEAQATSGGIIAFSSEQARKELGQLCVAYSRESFAKQAGEGDLLAVKLFLKAGMQPDSYDQEGKTPLMRAAYAGHREVAEMLLAAGANVNFRDAGGRTALFDAVSQKHFALVEALVNRGAEVNLKDRFEYTPLTHAVQPGNERILQFLIDRKANVD